MLLQWSLFFHRTESESSETCQTLCACVATRWQCRPVFALLHHKWPHALFSEWYYCAAAWRCFKYLIHKMLSYILRTQSHVSRFHKPLKHTQAQILANDSMHSVCLPSADDEQECRLWVVMEDSYPTLVLEHVSRFRCEILLFEPALAFD